MQRPPFFYISHLQPFALPYKLLQELPEEEELREACVPLLNNIGFLNFKFGHVRTFSRNFTPVPRKMYGVLALIHVPHTFVPPACIPGGNLAAG
jgi:hypothetical protein